MVPFQFCHASFPPLRLPGCLVIFGRHEHKNGGADALLSSLADAIGVYYNATGDLECFSPEAGANNASSVDANNWNWQVFASCRANPRPVGVRVRAFVVSNWYSRAVMVC